MRIYEPTGHGVDGYEIEACWRFDARGHRTQDGFVIRSPEGKVLPGGSTIGAALTAIKARRPKAMPSPALHYLTIA